MKWVSTKDRLPEYGVPVLGYCRIYGRSIRFYTQIADENAGLWDDLNTGQPGGLPPTHWMPLPEPPK